MGDSPLTPATLPWVHRAERRPLHVQVQMDPPLGGCWAVNLSETGVGLIARPTSPGEGPKEGQTCQLEWALPGSRVRIRAQGLVRWRHDALSPSGHAPPTALGVQFLKFEGADLLKLVRYLAAHRIRVVAAGITEAQLRILSEALGSEVEVMASESPKEAEEAARRGDVAACVVGRPGAAGQSPLPQVLWADASPRDVVSLFNRGDVHRALSLEVAPDELRQAVHDACRAHWAGLEQRGMELELERFRVRERARQAQARHHAQAEDGAPGFDSPKMKRVLELATVVAPHRVPVLLEGETGAGKEVLARRVHQLSGRTGGAFVAQDCGALTESLLESELFGHVKGAFTGAVADHPGLFVLADGGSIFLDEIENTTPALQARLLRVIETGEVRPVGGATVRQVDVRIIAASNRRLEEEVAQGRFRSDLFFRLNTFVVEVPPLRERPEDILPLARHFLDGANASFGRTAQGFAPEVEALFMRLSWRGNIRELRNVVDRAVLLTAPGAKVTLGELPEALVTQAVAASGLGGSGAFGAGSSTYAERLARAERAILEEALRQAGGVLRRAALALQMDPVTLARRARKLGLR